MHDICDKRVKFQSTLSVRRATYVTRVLTDIDQFQSTLSVRRATENHYRKRQHF